MTVISATSSAPPSNSSDGFMLATVARPPLLQRKRRDPRKSAFELSLGAHFSEQAWLPCQLTSETMTCRNRRFQWQLAVLLAQGRILLPIPKAVRTRSLARARAAISARATYRPEPMVSRRALVIGILLSLPVLSGVAGALTGLKIRMHPIPAPTPTTNALEEHRDSALQGKRTATVHKATQLRTSGSLQE